MELRYYLYLGKAIDEYLGRMGTITTKKIMNYVYSEYNLDANVEDISIILKERATTLEIAEGIFVEKEAFFNFAEGIDPCLLKSQIEFQYFVKINEKQMVKTLEMVKIYKNKKQYENEHKSEKKIAIKSERIEKEENELKWTYSKIVEFGMEYGYVNSSWVENIDYSLEKEVQDYFETIEEVEEKGIKVRYITDGDKLCK